MSESLANTGLMGYLRAFRNGGARPCYVEDPHVRLSKWGANRWTNNMYIEDQLMNRARRHKRLRHDYTLEDLRENIEGNCGRVAYPECEPGGAFETRQSRAELPAWTLRDGVDGTGNASSLGLAVAVLLGLVFWSGVVQDVRLFLSAATRFAVVGIRKDDDTYVLVDCTRTQRNAFDAILSAGPPPPPPLTYKVRRGCVLEMRRQNMWCVVVVLSVQSKDGGTAVRVRCAETGDEFPLCLASQTWRRLARGNACNVERVVVVFHVGYKYDGVASGAIARYMAWAGINQMHPLGFIFSSTYYMQEFWEENLSSIIPCYDIKFTLKNK